jgi:hypothetical protein
VDFPAFAAVAMAGIGWLPDTPLSRSIIVRMRRRHAGERVEPFRRRLHEREGTALRSEIEAWAGSLPQQITYPEVPAQVRDRDQDVWEPLIAIADLVGGEWPAGARVAAVALVADARETEPRLGIRLLADLRTVFEDAKQLTTATLLERLH